MKPEVTSQNWSRKDTATFRYHNKSMETRTPKIAQYHHAVSSARDWGAAWGQMIGPCESVGFQGLLTHIGLTGGAGCYGIYLI